MKRIPKQEYTAAFKEQAVAMVKGGKTAAEAARALGLVEQTLRNWVKLAGQGQAARGGQGHYPRADGALAAAGREQSPEAGGRDPKKSDGVLREGCTVKYAWIDRHRAMYPLALMCALLAVSLNGFRAWLRGGSPDRKRLTDAQLLALIGAIHAEVKGAYGSPRMLEELRGRGFRVGKARVERLMREHEIRARHKRRWKATTDSKHGLPVAPNVVERNFTPRRPIACGARI